MKQHTQPQKPGAGCSIVPPMPPDGAMPENSIDPTLLSLAMAFIPYQAWEEPYDYDVALVRGTLFPALDKPWIGEVNYDRA